MVWFDGSGTALAVQWTTLSRVAAINAERELVGVRLTGAASNYTGGIYIDDYVLKKNLTNERSIGNICQCLPLAFNGAGVDLELPAIGAYRDIEIKAAYLLPKTAITGDDTDYIKLTLKNKKSGNAICTKTFVTGVDADAYAMAAFGGVDSDEAIIDEGESASIIVTNYCSGMDLPDSLLCIEYNLA
jgi:hypothetical protein